MNNVFSLVGFYLLFLSYSFGQSGVITYKINSNFRVPDSIISTHFPTEEMRQMHRELKKMQEEKIKEIEFELVFNAGVSLFQLKADERYSDQSFVIAKLMSRAEDKYYLNSNDDEKIRHHEHNGYLINIMEDKCKWEITKETKTIDKYQATKAVCQVESFDQVTNKLIKRDYYAWFTYDLPVGFGPGGLDGLPGLVLEASLNKYDSYYATKVQYDPNNIFQKIALPKCDRTMTKEEFEIYRRENP
jgi:GLPGLI family protein